MKSFHLIMKVLLPSAKSEFFCVRLVGELDGPMDSSAMHWLAKVIDLGTPFIRDENR